MLARDPFPTVEGMALLPTISASTSSAQYAHHQKGCVQHPFMMLNRFSARCDSEVAKPLGSPAVSVCSMHSRLVLRSAGLMICECTLFLVLLEHGWM